MKKKNELMRQLFGACEGHVCKECSNFTTGRLPGASLCGASSISRWKALQWPRWSTHGLPSMTTLECMSAFPTGGVAGRPASTQRKSLLHFTHGSSVDTQSLGTKSWTPTWGAVQAALPPMIWGWTLWDLRLTKPTLTFRNSVLRNIQAK